MDGASPHSFRQIPYMGVIYVVHEAVQRGFYNGHPDWCNLGQGQPEVGEISGAPSRLSSITLEAGDHAYGPIGGTDELREVIAAHYNRLYRSGKASLYTKDNVSIASGGRLVLTRVIAAISDGKLGYQVPDYTAYEDLIAYHMHRLSPVKIVGQEADNFRIPPARLKAAIEQHDLKSYLYSNPCNPTGNVIAGEELQQYVDTANSQNCTIIHDEFYSHFIYNNGAPADGPVSAASHIGDVNTEPHILIDGLTKNYRYPGWRLGWAIGPKDMIESINRASSAIDGGPSQLVQRAAIDVLQENRADQETNALRKSFAAKRTLMLERLTAMGIKPTATPDGTFYIWARIDKLPAPFNNADDFFFKALDKQVMVVPGRFFNIDPTGDITIDGADNTANYDHYLRFSYGPPIDNVKMGLDRLQAMLDEK